MSIPREHLKIDFKKERITGGLCVFDFIDNGHNIAYLPSLNLTGYGDTKQEAHELLMKHVLTDFFEGLFTLSQSQVVEELKKLGWEKSHFFNKEFSKSYVDKDGVLREFNLPAETQIESQLMEVA
jgi:hypothetical protein